MSAPATEGFSSEELVTMDCPFTPYVSLYSGSLGATSRTFPTVPRVLYGLRAHCSPYPECRQNR